MYDVDTHLDLTNSVALTIIFPEDSSVLSGQILQLFSQVNIVLVSPTRLEKINNGLLKTFNLVGLFFP